MRLDVSGKLPSEIENHKRERALSIIWNSEYDFSTLELLASKFSILKVGIEENSHGE